MTIVLWLVQATILNTLIIVSTGGVHATITFPHDTEQCLDQLVEYQCTVDGTAPLILIWRILNNNGIENSSRSYTNGNLDNSAVTIGVFTVEQLQQLPLVSTISFTVQSSINGYSIQCEDGITMNNVNLTINITGMIADI